MDLQGNLLRQEREEVDREHARALRNLEYARSEGGDMEHVEELLQRAEAARQRMMAKERAYEEEQALARGPRPEPVPCERCGTLLDYEPGRDKWLAPYQPCAVCREADAAEYARVVRLDRLGLSPRERGWTFEAARAWPLTDSQKQAIALLESGASVWLWGRPGRGKTHLITAACIATAEAGAASVERWDTTALLRHLTAASRDGEEEQAVTRLATCDLLVLDDVDAARVTDFRLEALREIADARYTWERRTLVTSNLAPHKCAERVGERVTSRLAGLCTVLELLGETDGRRRKSTAR